MVEQSCALHTEPIARGPDFNLSHSPSFLEVRCTLGFLLLRPSDFAKRTLVTSRTMTHLSGQTFLLLSSWSSEHLSMNEHGSCRSIPGGVDHLEAAFSRSCSSISHLLWLMAGVRN